jgi:hypothetical protein
MAKRVGILTLYYKNANYGGVLQAYALQKVIDSMGMKSKQISYRYETGYPGNLKRKIISSIKKIVKCLIRQKWNEKDKIHRKKIYEFADTIPHTEVVSKRNLTQISECFDFFIVGSDQMWNPIGWQPAFFLDFLPEEMKRISYAVSMARDKISEKELRFIEKYANKFACISVRETVTANILQSYFPDMRIDVMPDPTLLLKAEEWVALSSSRLVEEPYVFAYCLGFDVEKRRKIIRDAEGKGYKVVFIPYMDKRTYEWDCTNSIYVKEEVGIPEFLSLIKNAEYVITDSFHGTVFSLIFHSPFFSYHRFKNDNEESMNSRITTLLEMFEIRNCSGDEIPDEIEELDWERVDSILEAARQKGYKYLSECIQ